MASDDRPAVSRSLLLAVLLALALASCTRTTGPAPVIAANSRQGATIRQHPDSVVVAQGETLYGVARRYDVPIRSLIEVNHLSPPFRLTAGQRLVLPQVRQYVVQQGDTLYSVSRRFGVDASTLAHTNDLGPPYPIHVGQALILPAPVQVAATSRAAPVVRPQPPQSVPAALPQPESRAPVAEPLPSVVQGNAGVPPASPPTAPTGVSTGQAPNGAPSLAPSPQTKPPPTNGPPAQIALATPPSRTDTAPPAPAKPEASAAAPSTPPPGAAAPNPSQQQAVLTPPAAPPEPPQANPPHTGLGFQWPVRGSILVSFGPGESGTHNDGINIAAAKGTAIAAANDGVVAYAGNELRGFGNLILIKHADGWMTAYAHCDTVLVKRGDRVRRGQTIAKVGMTGAVSEPQLHFEIRRGTRALDPISYLPPTSTASAE
jgi:murein DD-endopeptidase MepM/ murein hydrolase activator NlpD